MQTESQAEPFTASSEVAELDRIVAEQRERLGVGPADIIALKKPGELLAERCAHLLVVDPEREERIARMEAEAVARKVAEQQHASWSAVLSGAGTGYAKCTLQSYRTDKVPTDYRKQQEAAYRAVCEYAQRIGDRIREGVGLVLFGTVGSGKDHLAISVCKHAIKAQFTAGWINGQRWFAEIRDAMDTDKTERGILGKVANPDLLVLSDPLPNAGELTAYQATWLYRLADARRAAGKPTIVTVNVADDDEADRRLGEATWDRLCDSAVKIKCNWPSYRRPMQTVNC